MKKLYLLFGWKPGLFLARNTTLEGPVVISGTMLVHGQIEGDVHVNGDLHLGRHGRINGNVYAENAVVKGWVEGHVHIRTAVKLDGKSTIAGNLVSPRIHISKGAAIGGEMLRETGIPFPKQDPFPEKEVSYPEPASINNIRETTDIPAKSPNSGMPVKEEKKDVAPADAWF